VKVTKSFRSYFLLQASTPRTAGTEFGSWLPTPTAKNVSGGAVQVNANGKRQNKGGTEFSAQLHDLAKSQMLPTPTARCWNTGTEKERPADQPTRRSELNHLMAQEHGKPSQLSPLFVEEMMGFPKGWTASPFQSGEESQ